MKKLLIIICIGLFAMVNIARANETRMGTLMAGDYIDDLVNIGVYPHHIALYYNSLFSDIRKSVKDYGLIITPDIKYGALAVWQPGISENRFSIGYAINLFNFDIGMFGSPIKDQYQFGFGIGKAFFAKRIDLSFIINDETDNEWFKGNLRLSKRKGDFIITPRYKLHSVKEPFEYTNHKIGVLVQRLIFNEGFVFFVAEYDMTRGDLESDFTNIYAGFELPVSRFLVLRLGFFEQFTEGLENPVWQVEPGIGFTFREFIVDFHFNTDRIFEEDATLANFISLNSFGVDLNFGRF